MVALAFGNSCSNGSHPNFRDQFHTDGGMGGDVFQIVNQLRQIFNRINVVMGGRRNQSHTWHAVAQFTDVLGHFATWQLAAFSRLGTLGHLDLDLICRIQILGRYTKSTGCDLFDFGAQRVTILQGHVHFNLRVSNDTLQALTRFDGDALELLAVASRILAALTGVAFTANAVHGHGQGCMRFRGDGPQGHRTCGETFDDFTGRLHAIDSDGFAWIDLELKKTTQGHVTTVLVVDDLRILFVGVEIVGARAVLQLCNRIRRPHVVLASGAPCVLAARIQHVGEHRIA